MSAPAFVPLSGLKTGGAGTPGAARPILAESLVVGKDIVELLSTAMYVDPLSVYREYVQNAVDSIDEARLTGVLSPGEGNISITLDLVDRSARIRDDGMGVAQPDAERVLTSFGASRKRGLQPGAARGFRGVGRLAALGYAQVVTFRTKAAGEPRGTEVRWDCRRLRAILLDGSYTGSLADVVADAVTVREGALEAEDTHYFEVHLEKIVRLRNDDLLNEHEVGRYLAQVAPVPFPADFRFTAAIEEHLSAFLRDPYYKITVNGGAPIERPFRDEFPLTLTKTDRFETLEPIKIEDPDRGVVAVGWILHHNYLGAIQASSEIRGLRARVGNIQIGGSDIFIEAFPESRFNAWTVGEIHVLDPRVVPNGRRDNFERNGATAAVAHRLLNYGRVIARQCRTSSARRVQLRKFGTAEQKASEALAVLEQGALGSSAADSLAREIGTLFGEMEKLVGGLALDPVVEGLQNRLSTLRARHGALRQPSDGAPRGALAKIPQRDREAYTWAVELIYECAANRAAAKALVDRITSRLSGLKE
jgi:molecular chaperone HtpG